MNPVVASMVITFGVFLLLSILGKNLNIMLIWLVYVVPALTFIFLLRFLILNY